MKKFFVFLFLFISITTFCQTKVIVVPEPVSMQVNDGNFQLTKSTAIVASANDMHEAKMLNIYLKKLYGFTLPVSTSAKAKSINFKLISSGKKDEYHLLSNEKGVTITSASN